MEDQIEQQKALARVKFLRNEQGRLVTKIGELETEMSEYRVVIDAMKKVEPGRKCFRLVGGVLVERTAGEVLPAIEETRANIEKAINELQAQLEEKAKEMDELMVKYKIKFMTQEEAAAAAMAQDPRRGSQGVLV